MPLTPGLRWEVLRALERAREDVAHGYPSLGTALRCRRLSERAQIEVDRAVDDVLFEVPAEQLVAAALSEGGKSAEGQRLRDDMKAAQANARLPWVSAEQLTREQAVCLLFISKAFMERLPVVGAGPLFPALPVNRSNS